MGIKEPNKANANFTQSNQEYFDKNQETYLKRVRQVEKKLEKTQAEISLIHQDVIAIKSMFDQVKGGWRGLIAIIGGASLIGALIANILSVLKKIM